MSKHADIKVLVSKRLDKPLPLKQKYARSSLNTLKTFPREMFRQMTNDKQTPDHKLGNRTNRWWKVQADARCPSFKSSLNSNGNNVN